MNRYAPTPQRRQRRGGAAGKIVAFILGGFLGALFTVGGIVGVGVYYIKQPMDKIVGLTEKFAPGNVATKIVDRKLKKPEEINYGSLGIDPAKDEVGDLTVVEFLRYVNAVLNIKTEI